MTFFCLDETKYEARWRRRKEKLKIGWRTVGIEKEK